ncbi:MAG: transglycosylase domain-containing protein [Nanoarchaeota archaeon]|nr:transglycosylase domain-containing protein [Nanoarchaeota archaeon]
MSSRKPRSSRRKRTKFFLTFFGAFISLGLFLASLAVLFMVFLSRNLPAPEQFDAKQVVESTKIFDRTGKVLLYEIHGEEKRTVIPFLEIPDAVKRATLAAENASFYTDPAFDWKGIARAFVKNLKAGKIVQGGSTITQQLAKNLFLTPERTISRKIRELILAVQLEARYSKDEIFELYLNQIPYGSNAYGIESAAETFFNKSAKELTLSEAAALVAAQNATTYYSPWGAHVDELFRRQKHILDRMAELGFITKEEAEAAKKQKVVFVRNPDVLKASHFSFMVRDYLVLKYGEDMVVNGGLRAITTLDYRLQEIAERVVLENAERNSEMYEGRNAALVAEDPKTGQILALVGSKDPFRDPEPAGCAPGVNCKFDPSFNVPTQGLRQPGSALKPFAYLAAFRKGYLPETIVIDAPTEFASGNPSCPALVDFSNTNPECFHPQNFEGTFRGPISLATGLAQSVNVPSVKALYLAGFDEVLGVIRDFGITTLGERGRYGLSLVLGGGEVYLNELVSAYSALAEEGVRHEQVFILEVRDRSGKVLERYRDNATRVMDAQYPRMITQILSDADLRAGLFQNSLGLTIFPGREVAMKTGTTNDFRDAWTIGYTPNLVVGVWAGNNDNTAMQKKGGSILAAVPMWSAFLREALPLFPAEGFTRPGPMLGSQKPMIGGQSVYIPMKNGVSYPQIHSILYYVDKSDPLGGFPLDPSRDPQFANWEASALQWARNSIPGFDSSYNKFVPEGAIAERKIAPDEDITITNISPSNGSFVKTPFLMRADIVSKENLRSLEMYFNGSLSARVNFSGTTYPFQWFVFDALKSQNTVQFVVKDAKGKEARKSVILYN